MVCSIADRVKYTIERCYMKDTRIYVCHTLYHVFISILKELNIHDESRGSADIALSTVFMDWGSLSDRLEDSGIFSHVLSLKERYCEEFPDIAVYKQNHGNIIKHTINRIIFTKKFGKALDELIDIDFKKYDDIYVYCDSDPIGYYLNYHHIKYHAMEDGLDCLKNFDAAHFDNAGHFRLKAFLASLNLIFIQNGYSKYCIDMEINDDSYLDYEFAKYRVVPRAPLMAAISSSDKKRIIDVFLEDADAIRQKLKDKEDCILFLTEGYPGDNKEARIAISKEVLTDYCHISIDSSKVAKDEPHVIIKPHPRDDVDYEALYPMCTVIHGKFPIEVLNFMEGIRFKKAISIITSALDSMEFVDDKINIGPHIYDKYEPIEKHLFMTEPWDKAHPIGDTDV